MYSCFSLPRSSSETSGCPWLVLWSLCSCVISSMRCREESAATKTTCVLLTIWNPGEEPQAFHNCSLKDAFLQALKYIAQHLSKDVKVDNLSALWAKLQAGHHWRAVTIVSLNGDFTFNEFAKWLLDYINIVCFVNGISQKLKKTRKKKEWN